LIQTAAPARVLLALCVAAGLAASCGAGAATVDPALAIDTPSENIGLVWAMAADALDSVSDIDGQVIVVPSDDALLALDADALADLLATNRLSEMLDDAIIRAGFDETVQPGDVYLLSNGESVFVTEVDGQLFLDDHPLVESTVVSDTTVLVVDGVVVTP